MVCVSCPGWIPCLGTPWELEIDMNRSQNNSWCKAGKIKGGWIMDGALKQKMRQSKAEIKVSRPIFQNFNSWKKRKEMTREEKEESRCLLSDRWMQAFKAEVAAPRLSFQSNCGHWNDLSLRGKVREGLGFASSAFRQMLCVCGGGGFSPKCSLRAQSCSIWVIWAQSCWINVKGSQCSVRVWPNVRKTLKKFSLHICPRTAIVCVFSFCVA